MKIYSKKVKIFTSILVVICILLADGCSVTPKPQADLNRYSASFLGLFDTVTMIVGYAQDKEAFTGEAREIHDALEEYHRLYDIYQAYEGVNNLKTVNDFAGIKPVRVDRRIIDLLLFSKEMYVLTGGKVNVAMGSVLRIWHDYRSEATDDPEQARLPLHEELAEAARYMDIDAVVIDEEASTVYLSDPRMRLDVGAVAKGYAVEQVCKNLRAGLLVSAGGNVRATGAKPDGGGAWDVGVQDPRGGRNDVIHTLEVTTGSVVSSGSYQRYYTVEGKAYHHIINPDTLWPSEYFTAVTIYCEDSGLGDALSTAVYIMPFEDGRVLVESLEGVEAAWVLHDKSIVATEGYRRIMKEA